MKTYSVGLAGKKNGIPYLNVTIIDAESELEAIELAKQKLLEKEKDVEIDDKNPLFPSVTKLK